MVDRSGLYLVGAGNKITATSDGTYELVLGQGPNGEIYKFRAEYNRRCFQLYLQLAWSWHDTRTNPHCDATRHCYPGGW